MRENRAARVELHDVCRRHRTSVRPEKWLSEADPAASFQSCRTKEPYDLFYNVSADNGWLQFTYLLSRFRAKKSVAPAEVC